MDKAQKKVTQLKRYPINTGYFGEGSTYYPKDGRVYSLTWTDKPILIWEDLNIAGTESQLTLTYKREILLPSVIREGWGITHDNDYMYISNGSNIIYVVEPNQDGTALNIVRKINVDVGSRSVYFNEIEMVEDEYIYANNFLTDEIFKFRKDNGTLIKVWNVEELMAKQRDHVVKLGQGLSYDFGNNVLNGIAYNPVSKTFFLTGKRWDFMFEVQLYDDEPKKL